MGRTKEKGGPHACGSEGRAAAGNHRSARQDEPRAWGEPGSAAGRQPRAARRHRYCQVARRAAPGSRGGCRTSSAGGVRGGIPSGGARKGSGLPWGREAPAGTDEQFTPAGAHPHERTRPATCSAQGGEQAAGQCEATDARDDRDWPHRRSGSARLGSGGPGPAGRVRRGPGRPPSPPDSGNGQPQANRLAGWRGRTGSGSGLSGWRSSRSGSAGLGGSARRISAVGQAGEGLFGWRVPRVGPAGWRGWTGLGRACSAGGLGGSVRRKWRIGLRAGAAGQVRGGLVRLSGSREGFAELAGHAGWRGGTDPGRDLPGLAGFAGRSSRTDGLACQAHPAERTSGRGSRGRRVVRAGPAGGRLAARSGQAGSGRNPPDRTERVS